MPKSFMMFFIHKISSHALIVAMYLASVVDSTIHFCNLDCHETALPINMNIEPKVDFLESISSPKSASLNPLIFDLSFSKLMHTLEVFLRYLRIHFTAAQCSLPWLTRNLLTTPAVYDMFGLIHIITYIMLPTANAHGVFTVSFFSLSLKRLWVELNLKCPARGVPTSFAFFVS